MIPEERYDAVIIGASRAATFLGPALAASGWRVAIIEREYVGGTCVNVGCTPTKTMAASARVAHIARRASDFGVEVGPVSVDLAAVRQRKQGLVDLLRTKPQGMIEQADGLELVTGEARFAAPDAIQVRLGDGASRRLTADRFIIDVGGRPVIPPIPGLDTVPTLDSTSIMELETAPEHLLIVGTGYVALEFGQMFRRFGSEVTLIGRGRQVLGREDSDVAEAVVAIMRDEGVSVVLDATTLGAALATDGSPQLTIRAAEGDRTITGSHLLMATGRRPNSDQLDLPAAGVRTDKRGLIEVNDRLETNVPGVYAIGDVREGPALTHVAYDDFRVLRTNLVGGGGASTAGRMVPYTVFIDPQLGRIGLSETDAHSQGRNIRIAKLPMDYFGATRAREIGETKGFMKAVVDADTDEILGAAILSVEGGEIMSVLEVAMMGRLTYTAIRDAVFAHPTLAESLNDLFMAIGPPTKP